MDMDTLDAEALGTARKSMVRHLAKRRQVFEHAEEIDALLDRMDRAEDGTVRGLAFKRALATAAYANRRPR